MTQNTTIIKKGSLATPILGLMILFFLGFVIYTHIQAWQTDKYFYLLDKEGVKTTAKIMDSYTAKTNSSGLGPGYYLNISYKAKNGGAIIEQKKRNVEVSLTTFKESTKKGKIPILYLPNQPERIKVFESAYPDTYLIRCILIDIALLFMLGTVLYIYFFK